MKHPKGLKHQNKALVVGNRPLAIHLTCTVHYHTVLHYSDMFAKDALVKMEWRGLASKRVTVVRL